MIGDWQFGDLMPMKYGVILVDTPQKYKMYSNKGHEKSPEAHYKTMTKEEITALRISELAAKDCFLVKWSTWPHLEQNMQVLKDWGFTYKTGGAWHKKTRHGKNAFGTGYIIRSASEPFLIATIGSPKIASKSERNIIETCEVGATCEVSDFQQIIEAETRQHSRKPDDMRRMLERLFPNQYMVDLFAREPWAGYDVWGNEVDKFDSGNEKDS